MNGVPLEPTSAVPAFSNRLFAVIPPVMAPLLVVKLYVPYEPDEAIPTPAVVEFRYAFAAEALIPTPPLAAKRATVNADPPVPTSPVPALRIKLFVVTPPVMVPLVLDKLYVPAEPDAATPAVEVNELM